MCADGRKAMVQSSGVSRQHHRSHVDVGHERAVRGEAHFRFAGGARGQIQDRRIVHAHFAANALEQAGIFLESARADFAEARERQGFLIAIGRPGEQHPANRETFGAGRLLQSSHSFRVLGEDHARFAGPQVVDLIGQRITGIERRRNGARGHDAQIGQIKFRAGLRVKRHDIAPADAGRVQTAGDLLRDAAILGPSVGPVVAFAFRLVQRRLVAPGMGGLLQHRPDRAFTHRKDASTRLCPHNRSMPFEKELDLAREAVQMAAGIARRLQPEIVTEMKPDDSPVTQADRACEQAIAEMIGRAFPDDGILGEEGARAQSSTGRTWIVDPIDGTRDFVRGNPLWANLIALEQDGEVVLGVVHLPNLGWLCHGVKGGGAFRNGQRMRISQRTAVEDSVVCANDYRSFAKTPFAGRLLPWLARFWSVRGMGGAADAMMVSAGEAEVWIEPHAKAWDFAPIKIIAEEAGARYFTFRGTSSIYDGNAVVCVPALEAEVRALVDESRVLAGVNAR